MSGEDPNVNPIDPPADPPEEWTPPTKEEWEKAQRTAAVRKQERDEARREAAAAKEAAGKAKPDDDASKALEEARKDSDTRARRAAGTIALVDAGMTRTQAKEALALLKLDKLTVDGDGDVDEDDLAEAVKALKEKFPGMFPDGKKLPKARTADGGGRDGATKTPTDRTTERLMKSMGMV
jgi:hypothetical protein